MVKSKIIKICVAAAAVIVVALIVYDALSGTKTVEQSGVAMGAVVSVKLYGGSEDAAKEIIDAVQREEDSFISRYKPGSEIYSLNEKEELEVSDHTAEIISKAIEISSVSGGAFDITLGEISSMWDFDSGKDEIPSESDILNAVKYCGTDKITRNGNTFTLGENQRLDLGAVGKGIACDDAYEILKNHSEALGAVVSVGGSVLTYGANPDGDYWTVGVRTPEPDDTSVAIKIKLGGTSFISTSGNYEKYFEKDGKIYHHILSPETGFPADSSLKSVTVISDSGLLSDALSTACYVLGKDASAEILEHYCAEAIFIDNNNDVYITDGIFDDCSCDSDAYTLLHYGK